ncbi:MAG: DUF2127 domain-containing protein [Candidatus Vogelbacteria bacterium]|nr:DUF2127 domain-containing protein [Candidatus Vogelbacteria bacterium]
MTILKEENIHKVFELSLFLKAFQAVLELLSGWLLLVVSTSTIARLVTFLIQEEISEDPRDIVARYLYQFAQHLSVSGKLFVVFYLLSHGLIKIVFVALLWKNKLWAYPVSIMVTALFLIYQLYRYTYTQSIYLIVLSLFDIILIWLIWREYRHAKISLKIN